MKKRNINFYSWIAYAVLSLNAITQVLAAPGTLANSPLFTASNIPPNVFFELDDSGSMDWEILVKGYWDPCAYDRNNSGNSGSADCGSLVTQDGLIKTWSGNNFNEFGYIFTNNDNLYQNGCNNIYSSLGLCSATVQAYEWRVLSSSLNILYYNPQITYLPWQNGDGSAMTNASFTAARSNPRSTQAGYSLTKNLTGFAFEVWSDSHGFSGLRPRRGININRTTGRNGLVDFWDEHTRYTVNATNITVAKITYNPTTPGTTTTKGTLNATTATSTITTGLNGRTLAQEQQNIANWYQYYRKRSFVARAAIAKVISDNPNYRYGLNVINSTTFFTEVPTGLSGFSAHNTTLISDLFDFHWQALGTPSQQGLQRVGDYFDNVDNRTDPIVQECQQNFTAFFTDGYWNGANPSGWIGNADGDGHSLTFADVARYYYTKDLSPLANNVPTNKFDTNSQQHMVTFGIAFGLSGLLTDTDNDGWPGNAPGLAENGNWGNPFNSDPEKIDDLWHAAFNSKGSFVSASSPQAVTDAFSSALANIADRIGSASSVTFNTTTLSGSSAVYLAQFEQHNTSWTGDILAFALNSTTGDVSSVPLWSAADSLDALSAPLTSRSIITYNGTSGTPFQWTSLATGQQNDLLTEPNATIGTVVAKAQARLNFIRGDRTNEQGNGGTYTFRARSKLLGDIVDSDPVFVGKPRSAWPNTAPFPTASGQTYSEFSTAQLSRTEMIYVGANDGMLHGFKASDGTESLAYIPLTIFSSGIAASGLHFLTDPAYTHYFYVDMPSTVEDAYFNTGTGAAWHTVLIGGERAGGKGIFALDITNPASFSEANATHIALWEFDNSDDADMGYSFSKPTIAMMANGRWAAIFGNGYNNNGDGKAKLFILFLDGGLDGVWTPGTDYLELSTNAGSIVGGDCANSSSNCNGLSPPQTADINSDHLVDRVYAGDLLGNMWVFDLSDTVASNWKVAYSGSPLFIAGKPITDKPTLATHPTQPTGAAPNVLVFFGTGQYLVASDVSTTDVQAFYGVWDHGVSSITSSSLVEQTFLTNTFTNGGVDVTSQYSVLTNNAVDYTLKQGWFIRLTQNTGERVIVDSDVLGSLLFFNTWIPDSSPCHSGGSGVLMSVQLLTGGRPASAAFDLNGNNVIDINDLLSSGGTTYAATGERFNKGLPASSNFLVDNQYTPGTNGGSTIQKRKVYNPAPPPSPAVSNMKRISWQELRN